VNKIVTLIFLILTVTEGLAAPSGASQCSSLFQNETAQKSLFLRMLFKKLEANRIRPDDLQIEVKVDGIKLDLSGLHVSDVEQVDVLIKVKGKAAVLIELDRRFLNGQRFRAFQSHSSLVDTQFENLGLGTLGYLVAARVASKYFGSQLYSTKKPTAGTALPLWRRLVDFELAVYAQDPFDTGMVAMPSRRFQILDEALNSGDYDLIDRIIGN